MFQGLSSISGDIILPTSHRPIWHCQLRSNAFTPEGQSEPLCYNFARSFQSSAQFALKCSLENDDADEADGKNMAQRETDPLGRRHDSRPFPRGQLRLGGI
jgi:hypothetical protein